MKILFKILLFNYFILIISCGTSPLDDDGNRTQIEQQDLADVEKSEASPYDPSQMSGDSSAMTLSHNATAQVEIPEQHKSVLAKRNGQVEADLEVKKELETLKKSLSEKDQEFKDLANTKIPLPEITNNTAKEKPIQPLKPLVEEVIKKDLPKKIESPMIVNFAVEPKRPPARIEELKKKDRKPSSETKAKSKKNNDKEHFSFWPILIIFAGVALLYFLLNRLKYKNRFNMKN